MMDSTHLTCHTLGPLSGHAQQMGRGGLPISGGSVLRYADVKECEIVVDPVERQ
jgi:hypothetical protein